MLLWTFLASDGPLFATRLLATERGQVLAEGSRQIQLVWKSAFLSHSESNAVIVSTQVPKEDVQFAKEIPPSGAECATSASIKNVSRVSMPDVLF